MKKVLNILIGLTLVGFGTAASAFDRICWHNGASGTSCCIHMESGLYCAGHITDPEEKPVAPAPAPNN